MDQVEAAGRLKAYSHRVVRALSGPRCISLWGCLVAAISSFFATLATESVGQVALIEAIVRSLIVLLFTGLALWLANLIVRRKKMRYEANPLLVVLLFVVIGTLRPVVSSVIGWLMGSGYALDLPRIGMSVFTTVTGLVILAVALDALDQSAITIDRLKRRSEELLALRHESLERIEVIQASMTSSVLEPVIDRLMQIRLQLLEVANQPKIPSRIDEIAQEVRDLSDNSVRRTAYALAHAKSTKPDANFATEYTTKSRSDAVREATLASPYYPKVMAVLIFFGFLFGTIRIYGVYGLAISVILALVTGGCISLFQHLYMARFMSLLSETSRYIAILSSFVLTAALATLVALGAVLLNDRTNPELVSTVWANFFTVLTMTILISIGLSAIRSQRQMIVNLSELTQVLETEVGQQNTELDRLRLSLARQLHGDVQSRLSAVALRLHMISSHERGESPSNSRVESEIKDVCDELNRLALQLDNLEVLEGFEQFDVVMDELQRSWGLVIELQIESEPEVLERLNVAGAACRTVTEMVREGITNAVRHGGARSVKVSVTIDNLNWVSVSVVDDGDGVEAKSNWGLGLSSLSLNVEDLSIATGTAGGASLTGRVLMPQA